MRKRNAIVKKDDVKCDEEETRGWVGAISTSRVV